MPLYEYTCRSCSKRFEALVYGKEKPACPKCRGKDLEKMFSTFAAHGGDKSGDSPGSDFGTDLGGGDFGDSDGGDGGDMDDAGLDAGGAGGCGSCGDPRGPGSCAVN